MTAGTTTPAWLAREHLGMAHAFEPGSLMSVCRRVQLQRDPSDLGWAPASDTRARCRVCQAMLKAIALGAIQPSRSQRKANEP
jgi:hypothetical protein